jgi:hypothetical protein
MIGCGQLPEQQDSGWFEMAWAGDMPLRMRGREES